MVGHGAEVFSPERDKRRREEKGGGGERGR